MCLIAYTFYVFMKSNADRLYSIKAKIFAETVSLNHKQACIALDHIQFAFSY